jgi:hypothetical protein
MRSAMCLAALAFLVVSTGQALADDKADCLRGVDFIKAQIAKKPPQRVLTKLNEALKSAEQEVLEADWHECLDFVKKARQALRK